MSKNRKYRLYALLMGANFETILYLLAAWQVGIWLNENYPKDFDWSAVTYAIGLILMMRSWYVILRVIIKDQKKSSDD